MESSGACNLKGAVSREAAIAAPIIKLLWSPALEGEEGREKTQARCGGLGHEEIFLVIHAKKIRCFMLFIKHLNNAPEKKKRSKRYCSLKSDKVENTVAVS